MSFLSTILCCSFDSPHPETHTQQRKTRDIHSGTKKYTSPTPRSTSTQVERNPPLVKMEVEEDAAPLEGTLNDEASSHQEKVNLENDAHPEDEVKTEEKQEVRIYSGDETDESSTASETHSQVANDENMEGDLETQNDPDLTFLQPGQYHAPNCDFLLAPQEKSLQGKKCLVLDLDETLVHSSFKYLSTADFVLPVEIDDQVHNVYVIKRPGVDEFLQRVGQLYEVVVFTASVSRYGDPLLDILDPNHTIHHRLFREACYNYEGNYVKNLSQIGRPLSDTIILDNSPASYIFHPQHAVPISSWFSDAHDNELLDILPLLEDLSAKNVPDVGRILDVTI